MGFFRRSPDLGSTPLRLIPKRTAEDVKAEQERGREFTIEELRERRAQEEEAKKENELQERKKKREEEEKKEKEKKKKTTHPPHDDHSGEHDKHGAKSEHGDSAHHPEAVTHHGHAEEGEHKEHGDHGHEEKKEKKPGVGNFDVGKYVLLKKATDFHKAGVNHKAHVDHHDIDEYRNIKEAVSSLNKGAKRETFDFVNARFTTLVHHSTKDTKKFEKDFSLTASKFFPDEMSEVLFDTQKRQIINDIFEKTKDEIKDKKEKEAIKESFAEYSSQKIPDVRKVIEELCRVEFPSFQFRLFRANLTETLTCFYPEEDNPKKKKLDELHAAVDFFSQYREIEQKLFVEKQERKKTETINKQISKTKPLPTKTGGFIYKIVNPGAAPFIHSKTNFPKLDGGKIAYAIEFPDILPIELNLVDLIMNILEEYKNQKEFSDNLKERTKTIQNKIKDGIIKFPISTPSLDRVIKAFLALDFDEIHKEELPLPKVIRELPLEETTVEPILDIDGEEKPETTTEDVNGSEDTREEEAHPEQTTEDEIRKDDSAATSDNTSEEIKTPEGMQPEPEKTSIETEIQKEQTDVRKKTHIGYLLSKYLQALKRKYPSEELEEYLITLQRVPYKDILNYAKIHLLPEVEGMSVSLRVAIAHEDLDGIEKILRPPLSPEAAEAIQELITPLPEKSPLLTDAEQNLLLEQAEKQQKEREKALEFYNVLTTYIEKLLSVFPEDEKEAIQKYVANLETIEPTELLQYVKDHPLPLFSNKLTNLFKYLNQEIQKADTVKLKSDFEEILKMEEIQEALKQKENEKKQKEAKDEKIEFLKTEVTDYLSRLLPLYRPYEKENIQKIIEVLKELDEDDSDLFQVYSEVMHEISNELKETNSKLFVQTIKILEQFGRTKDTALLKRHFEAILNNQSVKVALARKITSKEKQSLETREASHQTPEDEAIRKHLQFMESVGLEAQAKRALSHPQFKKMLLSKKTDSIQRQWQQTVVRQIEEVKNQLKVAGYNEGDLQAWGKKKKGKQKRNTFEKIKMDGNSQTADYLYTLYDLQLGLKK